MATEATQDEFQRQLADLAADVAVDAVTDGWGSPAASTPVADLLTLRDSLSEFSSTVVAPPVSFDGFKFSLWANREGVVPYLYLAYHARRGDEVAAELLTAFRVTIESVGGPDYWPMASAEEGGA